MEWLIRTASRLAALPALSPCIYHTLPFPTSHTKTINNNAPSTHPLAHFHLSNVKTSLPTNPTVVHTSLPALQHKKHGSSSSHPPSVPQHPSCVQLRQTYSPRQRGMDAIMTPKVSQVLSKEYIPFSRSEGGICAGIWGEGQGSGWQVRKSSICEGPSLL